MKDLIVELNNRAKKENEDFIWIKNLIEKGPGVTFDKNILLKMISQPRCEGIRFYPALKSKGKEFFLSLVIVGVNSEGYDLHYNEGDKKIMDAYITKSLTGEYGHLPGEPLFTKHIIAYIILQVKMPKSNLILQSVTKIVWILFLLSFVDRCSLCFKHNSICKDE